MDTAIQYRNLKLTDEQAALQLAAYESDTSKPIVTNETVHLLHGDYTPDAIKKFINGELNYLFDEDGLVYHPETGKVMSAGG